VWTVSKTDKLGKLGVRDRQQDKEFQKGLVHKRHAQHQRQRLKADMEKVQQGNQNDLLLLHDFTLLKVQGTFLQCYIFVLYSFNAAREDKLDRRYYLFLGPKKKNDVRFVIQGWKQLYQDGLLRDWNQIHVWSDGGGKHFKNSANMTFMSILDTKLGGGKLTYNIFEAYHG